VTAFFLPDNVNKPKQLIYRLAKKIGRTNICILKEMHTYIIFNISKGHNSKILMIENYKISKLICNCNIFETLAHVEKSNMDYLL